MAELVERTRELIGDVSVPPVFSDDAIQAVLDEHVVVVEYERTRPHITRAAGGAEQYVVHTYGTGQKARGNFDTNVALFDSTYTEIEPTTSDLINGRWTIPTSMIVVFIVGNSFDVFGAAASLLEKQAATMKLKSNFMDAGTMVQYGQRFEQVLKMAALYRKRGRRGVRAGRLISTDFAG